MNNLRNAFGQSNCFTTTLPKKYVSVLAVVIIFSSLTVYQICSLQYAQQFHHPSIYEIYRPQPYSSNRRSQLTGASQNSTPVSSLDALLTESNNANTYTYISSSVNDNESKTIEKQLSTNDILLTDDTSLRTNQPNVVMDFSAVPFDMNSSDVMVFLHIQKTGGTTFGRHLVHDLDLRKDCVKAPNKVKRYDCLRPNSASESWLFSRYTTGWKCGLHASWTNLHECVHELFPLLDIPRNFYYFTIVREPIARYLSEWQHVQRGATWYKAYLRCNGNAYPYPRCFQGEDWMGVSLEEFMACEENWANNRQTHMLADMRVVNCSIKHDQPLHDQLLLESAKHNLMKMAYFGLVEEQEKSRVMFEYVFDLHFVTDFALIETRASKLDVTSEQMETITRLNRLDVELYKFAANLFRNRYEVMKQRGLLER